MHSSITVAALAVALTVSAYDVPQNLQDIYNNHKVCLDHSVSTELAN